ncbi:MAG: YkgJ family cysteine cluster protein [Fibrobacteria bacterium]|nr:YkgJ family cysteine cluster protein [Fibrobacteria bacterium]
MTNEQNEKIFSKFEGDSFKFRCHKDISCFNECCAKLKLVLTPYDVLRLKNRLGLSSEEFIDKYTETTFEKPRRFPIVLLKMADNEKQSCPFVSPEGCTIYADRPGACRIYPLGRATKAITGNDNTVEEEFFVVKEKHCRGFEEEKTRSKAEWMQGEGLEEYNEVNDKWLSIITSNKGMGDESAILKKTQMYFMACYNLEKFKAFIFKSSFFGHFDVSDDEKEQIAQSEKALLLFALNWLRFSLFGEQTIRIKC